MYIELPSKLNEQKLNTWKSFLKKSNLNPDTLVESTVLIWDNDVLVATGSRNGNLLKCIAVDETRQGEGLVASLITALRKDAFSHGVQHLFLYTKPQNKTIFSDLFFYEVAQTQNVLLMEDKKDGVVKFLNDFHSDSTSGKTGCIVMNSNPFTLGHRYLIETAAKECDRLYVFVVSEDKSEFSAKDRMEMVKKGTAHIPNVSVLPTGPYLISMATFPTYFIKESKDAAQIKCMLDIEIFTKYYAPKFNITVRYVGTEPLCAITQQYNEKLKEFLPLHGIEVKEISRIEQSGTTISASYVRELIKAGNVNEIKKLVPSSTYDFLLGRGLL